MLSIRLSRRLAAIAALLPPDGGMADVGTDHGHIPVHLLQSGFSIAQLFLLTGLANAAVTGAIADVRRLAA